MLERFSIVLIASKIAALSSESNYGGLAKVWVVINNCAAPGWSPGVRGCKPEQGPAMTTDHATMSSQCCMLVSYVLGWTASGDRQTVCPRRNRTGRLAST